MHYNSLILIALTCGVTNAEEKFVLPVDKMTMIELTYRDGSNVQIDLSRNLIISRSKNEVDLTQKNSLRIDREAAQKYRNDLCDVVLEGLNQGMFTKESSQLTGVRMVFDGPFIVYHPMNDFHADLIKKIGDEIRKQIPK